MSQRRCAQLLLLGVCVTPRVRLAWRPQHNRTRPAPGVSISVRTLRDLGKLHTDAARLEVLLGMAVQYACGIARSGAVVIAAEVPSTPGEDCVLFTVTCGGRRGRAEGSILGSQRSSAAAACIGLGSLAPDVRAPVEEALRRPVGGPTTRERTYNLMRSARVAQSEDLAAQASASNSRLALATAATQAAELLAHVGITTFTLPAGPMTRFWLLIRRRLDVPTTDLLATPAEFAAGAAARYWTARLQADTPGARHGSSGGEAGPGPAATGTSGPPGTGTSAEGTPGPATATGGVGGGGGGGAGSSGTGYNARHSGGPGGAEGAAGTGSDTRRSDGVGAAAAGAPAGAAAALDARHSGGSGGVAGLGSPRHLGGSGDVPAAAPDVRHSGGSGGAAGLGSPRHSGGVYVPTAAPDVRHSGGSGGAAGIGSPRHSVGSAGARAAADVRHSGGSSGGAGADHGSDMRHSGGSGEHPGGSGGGLRRSGGSAPALVAAAAAAAAAEGRH